LGCEDMRIDFSTGHYLERAKVYQETFHDNQLTDVCISLFEVIWESFKADDPD